MQAREDDVMRIEEAAERWNVTRKTARTWASKGIVPAVKVGALWFVRRDAITGKFEEASDEGQ